MKLENVLGCVGWLLVASLVVGYAGALLRLPLIVQETRHLLE